MKKVVFTFGRMNPPTTGHQLLVNKLVAYARQIGAAPRVYLSHSVGVKDPLQYDKKVAFARAAFGSLVKKSNARTVIEVLKSLEKEGYTHVTMFAGSDRVPEFQKLLDKYNGKEYDFEHIEVKSAGERDPDADDVSGMSASKMRALAKDDKVAEFLRGAPNTLKAAQAKNMFTAVRRALLGEDVMDYNHDEMFVHFVIESSEEDAIELPSDGEISKMIDRMDIADLDLDDADAAMLDILIGGEDDDTEESDKEDVKEARILSGQARQKLSQRMKGMSKRLARLRQIKAKQMPAQQRLRLRARKAALMALRKRATGKKNLDYNSLSRSQRIAVDTALVQRFGNKLNKAVDVLSKRILPKIRSMAQKNVAKARDMKEENINELFSNNPHLLGKTKEGSPKDTAQDKLQAAKRGISVKDWEKTKADASHDSPLNVDATKLNTLDTDPTLNDRTAFNPKQSHLNVNKKLMHYARNDEAVVHEGRKSADDKDARDAGDTNIIYQMRKVVNSRGEHETVFADKHKAHISIADAKKLLAKFDALRLPADKHEFTIQAGASLAKFRDVLAHGVKHEKKKISLGGKQFKEFYLGVGRTRTTGPFDYDEPPGTRRIAEVAKDEDRPTDPNKARPLSQKLDLLLRLGLSDQEELQKYRRALRSSKKHALQSPQMREALANLLDKLIDLTTKDPATYSRVRYNVVNKEAVALLNKAEKSGVDVDIIFEVFARGYEQNEDINEAFSRVNSFIAGGKAAEMDKDLTEGEVVKTKLAQKLLQKKGIVPPHEPDMDDMMRNWFMQKKLPVQTHGADRIAYHGDKARFYNDTKKTHYDIKGGAPKLADVKGGKLTFSGNASPVSYKQDKVKKKVGNVIKFSDLKKKKTNEAVKEPTGGLKDACWSGYTAVGMKMKNGRKVPNCVPKNEAVSDAAKRILGNVAKKHGGKVPFTSTTYKDGKKIVTRGHNDEKGNRVVTSVKNEEVINELGSATLSSYKSKAASSEKSLTDKSSTLSVPAKDRNAAAAKANQRRIGMKLATKKIGEEVEQIDEISSAMLYRAKQAAQKKAGWLMPGDKGKGDKAWNRVKKFRDAGVKKQEQERKAKTVKEQALDEMPSVRSAAKGNLKGRLYDPDKMYKQNQGMKGYRKPWELSKTASDAEKEKAMQTFTGAIKKIPPGKKAMKYIKLRDGVEQSPLDVPVRGIDSGKSNKKVFEGFRGWQMNEVQRRADVKMVKAKLPDGRVVYRRERAASDVQHEAYTGSEPASNNTADPANRFVGTNSIRQNYASVTPGQGSASGEIAVASFAPEKVDYSSTLIKKTRTEVDQSKQNLGQKHLSDIRKTLGGIRESRELNESFSAGFELAPFARDYGIQVQSSFEHHPEVQEALDAQEDAMNEAIYQGREVPLGKPMKGDVKKSKVYVRDPSTGNVKKVNFGDKKLSIKKDQPARKRSYCARSSGQGNLNKKTSANYWSRRAWDC
jgi:hypothetical protein